MGGAHHHTSPHPGRPGGLVLQRLGAPGVPEAPTSGFSPLSYLVHYVGAVEINASFYRIPTPKITQSWVDRVAAYPDFRFTAKLWQGFTHEGQAGAQDEAAFRQAMDPSHNAGRLGAVLLQFSYRVHHTPENRAYMRRLADAFPDYPLMLEVRHRSWDCAGSMRGCRRSASASAPSTSPRCHVRSA